MYDVEREKAILEVLEKKGTIGVNRLAQIVYCSGSTIRRDLTRMEEKGLVKRTFGAVSLASAVASEETSFSVRESVNISKKKILSKEAASHLQSGMTVFIDSSTTLFHIVRYLSEYKDLLFITNGLKIAAELAARTQHKVVAIGGEVMPHSNSMLGSSAITQAGTFHADVALLSCTGVSADFGFSEANYDTAEIKKQMLLNSALKIMVFDETKVGVAKAFQTCPLTDVDIVITMKGIDPKIKGELEAAGKTVIECALPSSKAD